MSINVDIIVNDPLWTEEQDLDVLSVLTLVRQHLTLLKQTDCSVLLTNDEEIKTFNSNYRKKDSATNVLSFPCEGIDGYVGDLVLSFETIKTQSKEQNKSFHHHAVHMIVHGFLHLLGYDHIEDEQAELMEAHEVAILSSLNIKNPYK